MPVKDKYWIIVLVCAVMISLVAVRPINQNPTEPPNPDMIGRAIHPLYPAFSAPEPGFTVNGNLLSASDDAVYKTGYYSINGGAWQSFSLTGTALGGSWLTGTATKTLPSFGTGEHYVVVYSCNHNSGSWDCYENRWQLIVINNVAPACTGSTTRPCNITNGAGIQSRTCNSGVWSGWSTCKVVSCNANYIVNGNTCIFDSRVQYTIEGQTYTNSGADPWEGVDIPRLSPTLLTFRNNFITSNNYGGYMLQCGDDELWATAHNLDDAIISGNKFSWTGTPGATLTHGMMAGYNINYNIKYNYVDGPYYGVVWEGGYNDGSPMINTEGGVYYNILKNTRIIEGGFKNCYIYNNVFYSDLPEGVMDYSITIRISNTGGLEIPATNENVKIKNNIFYSVYNRDAIIITSTDFLNGFECDYNVYYWEDGVNHEPSFTIGDTSYTWAQWRALGYDTHSVIVNPRFIDTVNFVPASRLNYGTNLGSQYNQGLSVNAGWEVGVSPQTSLQNGAWQVGARLYN